MQCEMQCRRMIAQTGTATGATLAEEGPPAEPATGVAAQAEAAAAGEPPPLPPMPSGRMPAARRGSRRLSGAGRELGCCGWLPPCAAGGAIFSAMSTNSKVAAGVVCFCCDMPAGSPLRRPQASSLGAGSGCCGPLRCSLLVPSCRYRAKRFSTCGCNDSAAARPAGTLSSERALLRAAALSLSAPM